MSHSKLYFSKVIRAIPAFRIMYQPCCNDEIYKVQLASEEMLRFGNITLHSSRKQKILPLLAVSISAVVDFDSVSENGVTVVSGNC